MIFTLFFHSDSCSITEVNGFLKMKCADLLYDIGSEFQCAFSKELYRIYDTIAEVSQSRYSYVSKICSNDTYGYQVHLDFIFTSGLKKAN